MKVLLHSSVLLLVLFASGVKSENRVFTKEELAKYNGEDVSDTYLLYHLILK